LVDSFSLPPSKLPPEEKPTDNYYGEPFGFEEESQHTLPEADFADAKGKPLIEQYMTDLLMNYEVLLPQGEGTQMAKVMKQAIGKDGKPVGSWNENPILSTLVYDVEFPD